MKTTTYLAAALSGMYYTTAHHPLETAGGQKTLTMTKVILMADQNCNQAAFVAVEASNSTVICANCPPVSSTPDVVTRSAVPTTPCTAPSLTAVYSSSTTEMTTSTVYTSIVYTVTSCPPTVTNCPVGQKTTEMTSYTTVCPVSSPAYSSAVYSSAVYTSAGSVYTSVYTAPGMMTSASQASGSIPAVATTTGVVPVTAGASNLAVGMGGAAAVAVAALFML